MPYLTRISHQAAPNWDEIVEFKRGTGNRRAYKVYYATLFRRWHPRTALGTFLPASHKLKARQLLPALLYLLHLTSMDGRSRTSLCFAAPARPCAMEEMRKDCRSNPRPAVVCLAVQKRAQNPPGRTIIRKPGEKSRLGRRHVGGRGTGFVVFEADVKVAAIAKRFVLRRAAAAQGVLLTGCAFRKGDAF